MSKELADSSGLAATANDGSRVATRTKFYFGVGAGGEAASNWIFHALGMIFYQQVLGLVKLHTSIHCLVFPSSDQSVLAIELYHYFSLLHLDARLKTCTFDFSRETCETSYSL